MAALFETVMLVCFGASWPVSCYKSWKSRKTGGKSLLFLCLIELGYLVGLLGKALYAPGYVILVYVVNATFVATDIALYFRNKRLERRAARGA